VAAAPEHGRSLDELIARARAGLVAAPASPAPAPPGEQLDERRLHLFVGLVVVAGGGVLAAALFNLAPDLLLHLVPFLLVAILAERLTDLAFGKTSTSLGAVGIMAAAALGGPATGAVVGLASGLAAWRFGAAPLMKEAFNVGMVILAAAAAGIPYWLAGGTPTLTWPAVGLGILAGLVYFGVNFGLLAKVIALATGTTWLTEWRLHCNWLILHYAIMGGVSLGLVVLYQTYGLLGLVLLMAPIGILYYAQRQYTTHTSAYVDQLSSLNYELKGSNELLTQALTELHSANDAMLTAFSESLELRDQETKGHSQRVVHYSRALAVALGLSPEAIKAVIHGALLHDIGKIGVRDAILHKPGALTAEERAEIQRHVEIGHRMIAHIPFLAPAALLVRHHHERWDGRGYPDGLAGEAIPLGARIFAVADTFDAMTSDRPYRAALSWEAALDELQQCAGTQFDPQVVIIMTRLVCDGLPWRPAVLESLTAPVPPAR
jgi:hypothetical protein